MNRNAGTAGHMMPAVRPALTPHDHDPDGYVERGTGCTFPGCDAVIILVEGTFDDVTIEWQD